MNQNERLEELNKLPIARFLDAIRDAFQRHKRVVIAAPTGSGKSTVIPLLLAKEWLPAWGRTGRVVVVEPRRIAATSLAARVAELWGVRLGDQVGYVIRHDRRDSNATRLLYVTDGVIGRWLDSDPLLEGTDAVILDEFHERRTETDVALGRLLLANQKRQRMGLPPILLGVFSATIEGRRVSEFVQGPFLDLGASQIQETPDGEIIHNGLYPVVVRYIAAGDNFADILRKVPEAVEMALKATEWNVVVFLPGKPEIEEAQRMLRIPDVDIVTLHAELDDEEQRRALEPDREGRRKVILSTNILESSVTVEDLGAAVDTMHEKVSETTPMGIHRLVLQPVSRSSAIQRAGRLGRLGEGLLIRMIGKDKYQALPESRLPEILREDIMTVLLRLEAQGIKIEELPLLDRPDPERVEAARRSLADLGLLAKDGQVTEMGRMAAAMPLSARLARMVLETVRLNAGLELVLRTAAAASVQGLIARFQDPAKEESARRARSPLEEAAARLGSDLFLGAFALDLALKGSDGSLESLRNMGFRVQAVLEARSIFFQLREELQNGRDALRRLGVELPDLAGKPRSQDFDPAAARRAIAAGLADRLAYGVGRGLYKVLAPEPFYARLARESLLARSLPHLIAVWEPREIVGKLGSFYILTGCTVVEPKAFLDIAPARAALRFWRIYWDEDLNLRAGIRVEDVDGAEIFEYEGEDPAPADVEAAFAELALESPDIPWLERLKGLLGEDDEAWRMAAGEVGRIAREVGARSWSQLLPHLPEAEELARRIRIRKGGEG
ncbi:DEAD/DEAH box helicase [Thermoflexus sp.]|jgi:HrpA-like RNA helicase|uniref:DEAD/DEAH box helicase n=1 Tax=Thermoflexus sp. TaxID=1969742 RepID=UPI003C033CFD